MIIDEKLKAAYALNLWTVSVSQIVDYNDVNILEQEYNTIMNNLNLENMPKDEALLDVIKEIMDEITNFRIDDGDRAIVEKEYQHQLKNAVWSAVPSVGAIFATSDPVIMCITLATQVGIGYMNYRRNKAEYELGYEKAKWEIQKNRMQHLNGLQKQLFETAWRLADTYEFPDEYRLTAKQITEYNKALMEVNPVKRYNKLDSMRDMFDAYPVFWYQFGSTANSIYRSTLYDANLEVKSKYRAYAIEYFERYYQLNKFNLLRHDLLTASWALEYLELLDLNQNNNPDKAKELIGIAEKYSGNALDVLELCAFAYLRIGDYDNAIKAFHKLVNNDYNLAINVQVLSGLYIKRICEGDAIQIAEAHMGYAELPNITGEEYKQYILELPPKGVSLDEWKPAWNQEESIDEFIEKETEKQKHKKEKKEEAKKKARLFYQRPIRLVYASGYEDVAEYFKSVLDENRKKLDDDRLPYSSTVKLKDYLAKNDNSKTQKAEFDELGYHVILIGDSDEAKNIYKNANSGRWDYYNLGMRFVSKGQKTVILARRLKDEDIDELIRIAHHVNRTQAVKIPGDTTSVKYTFWDEMYSNVYKEMFQDKEKIGKDLLAAVTSAPKAILGTVGELGKNAYQWGTNLSYGKELEFLQYSVAIYKYLESQGAIVYGKDNS